MNLKIKFKRFFRILRNISLNISKIVFSKTEESNIFIFLKKYKYILAISFILLIALSKNIFLITKYTRDINEYKQTITEAEAHNNQLKEDLKYYATDEFVYRYAMSELNMRPTKPSNLIHVKVFPAHKEEEDIDTSNTENTTQENEDSTNTENTTQENEDSANTENTTEEN